MPTLLPAMITPFWPRYVTRSTAAASAISDKYGATIRTVEEIAATDGIDAVVLSTPTDLHAQQIELFARALAKLCFVKSRLTLSPGVCVNV